MGWTRWISWLWFCVHLEVIFLVVVGLNLINPRHVAATEDFSEFPDRPDSAQEFCLLHNFSATCPKNHVILMTYAVYGKMRLGICLTRNEQVDRACWADVLPIMDKLCSGRRSCQVYLPVAEMHALKQCLKDSWSYLEASYTCLKAFTDVPTSASNPIDSTDTLHCSKTKPAVILEDKEGFISPLSSYKSDCPIRIKAPRGQFIELFLFDFISGESTNRISYNYPDYDDSSNHYRRPTLADSYAKVTEESGKEQVLYRVQGRGDRHTPVYKSTGNVIDVSMMTRRHNPNERLSFLIRYEVHGCVDPRLPADAWLIRKSDSSATIKCNFTSNAWHLVCKDSEWVGEVSNCTEDETTKTTRLEQDNGGGFYSYGLLIAIVIGVILGAVCGFILLSIVLACRRRLKASRTRRAMLDHYKTEHCQNYGVFSSSNVCHVQHLDNNSTYTHVWKVDNPHSGRSQGSSIENLDEGVLDTALVDIHSHSLHRHCRAASQAGLGAQGGERSEDYCMCPGSVTYVRGQKLYDRAAAHVPQVVHDAQVSTYGRAGCGRPCLSVALSTLPPPPPSVGSGSSSSNCTESKYSQGCPHRTGSGPPVAGAEGACVSDESRVSA